MQTLAVAKLVSAGGLLESLGLKEEKKWKECDTSAGYDHTKHAYHHFRLAVALQEQGQADGALASFDLARQFDEDLNVDAMLNMGLLSLQLGRLVDAEIHLTNVVRAIGSLSAKVSEERRDRDGENEGVLRAMSALADVYARTLRVDQAKSTYKKVIKGAPHDTETLVKLGSLQQWLGGLRHDPMEWVDALTAHASALRSPKLKAAYAEDQPLSEEAERKQGQSLAAAYRSAPEIHLRMAGLLQLVANFGVTGRGLVEAADHIASAIEMSDTGSALGWRALFTQLRLDTRLCAWQQRRPQTAVTADFLHHALHARPPTAEEASAAIKAAEEAAAKADADEAAAAEEMAKLTAKQRKDKRKAAKKAKKENAQNLENLLAAQAALAGGATNVPTIPLTPFEIWELPYLAELGTLASAAARAQGMETTAYEQLTAAQALHNGSGAVTEPAAVRPRYAKGVAVPEDRRAQVAVLFPSWWNDSFLAAFVAMMKALAAPENKLEMVIYNLAGDETAAAATIKGLCEETWEATDGAIRMVEGGYLDDEEILQSLREQELDVVMDLQGHLPMARQGLLPSGNISGIGGREVWRLAMPSAWAAGSASLGLSLASAVTGEPNGSSTADASARPFSRTLANPGGEEAAAAATDVNSVAGGPHGLLTNRISSPPELSGCYAEDLHYLSTPWAWGWTADEAKQSGTVERAGRLRGRAAHGVSPRLLDVWVQASQRLPALPKPEAGWFSSGDSDGPAPSLMIVEVIEEARPQLRNESHARGQTALDFEVGHPKGAGAAVGGAAVVIMESNEECAVPKLDGLRRALVKGNAQQAVILPGQGMCARAAAVTAVSLGRGFGPLVSSYKEYEDLAVSLATPAEAAAVPKGAKHSGAWGAPPPRCTASGGGEGGGAGEAAVARWAKDAASLLRTGGVAAERQ